MNEEIDISTFDKADVLAALFNYSKTQGLGILHFDARNMSRETVAEYLKQQTYFDYLQGRIMKVDLGGNSFDPRLYDRDNGKGAALRALESLRGTP